MAVVIDGTAGISHYTYMLTIKEPTDARSLYIGVRTCKTQPELDVSYLGSCKPLKSWIKANGADKVEKIILSRWPTREEAMVHEVLLHGCFDVGRSQEFWNQARQTSARFHFDFSGSVRGPLSDKHKKVLSDARKGVPRGAHKPETIVKQSGSEYHCPKTGKTIRFKTHLGETPLQGWVKGRALLKPRFWMTDGVQNKPVHDASEVPSNWHRGRTMQRSEKGQFV